MACLRLRNDRYFQLFANPYRLIQLGYQLSRLAGRWQPVDSRPFAAALRMVGLGVISNIGGRICRHCFRVAPAALASCRLHSQSKFVGEDMPQWRSRQAHAARTGRRAIKRLNWPAQVPCDLLLPFCPEERVIAGILWSLHVGARVAWTQAVAEALQNTPLVQKLLSENFLALPNREQLGQGIGMLRVGSSVRLSPP